MDQDYRNFQAPADVARVMTIGDWIITILLTSIPFVNIIMLIVWAVGSTENPNRKNWAIAMLIFMGIGIALYILFFATLVGAFSAIFSNM